MKENIQGKAKAAKAAKATKSRLPFNSVFAQPKS
jgi:hypothetical protein